MTVTSKPLTDSALEADDAFVMERRLEPELVPRRLWGVSAHQLLPTEWRRDIRPLVVEEHGGLCSRCGASTKKMFAHERWQYDDARAVATIVGLELVCSDCNGVLHLGRLPQEHRMSALAHLARVNGTTLKNARRLYRMAYATWRERSLRRWAVAVDPQIAARYPILAELPARATARERVS
jgi:hypothetical protein